jgi:hypothetical protein
LQPDAARWGEQIRAEYQDTIQPQLTDQERSALNGMKIEIPISGPKGDPFEFYSDGSTIYLPALSLRFYSDLCVANAWLNAHGFEGTTVRDYVGWLFKQAAASSRAPLQKRNQEIEADQFAIQAMRRIGQVPLGLELWFDVERIRHVEGVQDLKPRKSAFTIPGTEQEPGFNGLFAVRRTAADGGQDRVDLLLLRMGDEVTSGYSNGKVDGFIEGNIRDGVLDFTWREGGLNGRGVAESQGDTLRGTWELAARSKAQASLLAYGKNETRLRRKRTPKDFAFCRFD